MRLFFNKQTLWHSLSKHAKRGAKSLPLGGRLEGVAFLCIITAALPLAAQTVEEDSVINRNITIEREYRPVIQDAGKINTLPHFAEPNVAKITPRYTTDFSKPLNVDQNIHYLSPAGLNYQRQPNKEGYARVGIGTGFNSLADFAYPLLKKRDMKLDFVLNHYGLFNRKAHSNTQAVLAFDKKFDAIDLFAGIGGGHEYYKYYGTAYSAPDNYQASPKPISIGLIPDLSLPGSNNLWRGNAHIGIRTSPANAQLRYGVTVNYNLFNSRQGITEHDVQLNANIDGEVGDNRLGVDIGSQNLFYNTTREEASFNNRYILKLNPYYAFEKKAFDLRLGVNVDFAFGSDVEFLPSLDIDFDWRAVPRILSLYAGINGGYQPNSLDAIYRENCYLNPDFQAKGTHTPIDAYLGFKVKPATGLLFDAYVDYKYIIGQYFFVNQGLEEPYLNPSSLKSISPMPDMPITRPSYYLNRFELTYVETAMLKVGGRISYNYHDRFNIAVGGAYNWWDSSAWYKPTWELDVNANGRITSKLNVYANAGVCGKRKAVMGLEVFDLKPKVDINLGASYAILDWLSAFLKVNNLINNKHELWLGYEAQGFNVMAGATFNF